MILGKFGDNLKCSSALLSRVKKETLECSGALLKPGKKPKFVVHAAGDVGISGDGYRWRKYGQKMVKGNPHPRCMFISSFVLCMHRDFDLMYV